MSLGWFLIIMSTLALIGMVVTLVALYRLNRKEKP